MEARKSVAKLAPIQSIDPGAERLAAVLGIEQSKVQLYVPLFLPLGLELGGFIFLALGLAPARRPELAIEPIANRARCTGASGREAVAGGCEAGARCCKACRGRNASILSCKARTRISCNCKARAGRRTQRVSRLRRSGPSQGAREAFEMDAN